MSQPIPPRRPLVLVVEDEPLLLMMAVDLVEEAGLRAIEARNADEALKLLQEHGGADVLFTDIDMPGSMNGLDLAAAARTQWPSIEILLVSGHVKIVKDHLPQRSVFLSKPYDQVMVTEYLGKMVA
jgi:CheY-like chemotaxis protein